MSQLPRPKLPEAKTEGPTSNFKIGDRVYVGGTKPGKIAFLGDTKFAPGEWAGVALDEAQGKNDGSVGGVVYFTCEPMHGVFSRTSRLTTEPGMIAAPSVIPKLDLLSKRGKSSRSSVSPSRSDRGGSPSGTPSPAESTSSLASLGPLKIGDRVIVASATTGTKTGTLRFMGPTDFAQGEWAGVELDGPIGKNDGSVGEKRYFECPAKHGLFAPLHKVSKSPRNRMQRQPSSLTPGKLCRQRSDLSDMSTTSVTSSASKLAKKKKSISSLVVPERLKMTLKEKESKIEQLLKEREMERAQIAKAASQTDEAESNLTLLRHEYLDYKAGQEERATQLNEAVDRLEAKNKKLEGQLEDERRKNEDLTFKMEEESIMRGDDAKVPDLEAKIGLLTKEKVELASQVQILEARLRAEEKGKGEEKEQFEVVMASMKKELDTERKKNGDMTKQVTKLTEKLESAQHDCKKEKEKYERCKEESDNKAFETEEQILIMKDEIETLTKKLQENESSLEREKKQMSQIQDSMKSQSETSVGQISTLEKQVSDKDTEILELTHKLETLEKSLNSVSSNLEEKSTELKSKTQECLDLAASLSRRNSEFNVLEDDLKNLKSKFEASTKSVEDKEADLKSLRANLTDSETKLQLKTKETEELKNQVATSGNASQLELQKKSEEAASLLEKLKLLENETKDMKKELEEAKSQLIVAQENNESLSKDMEHGKSLRENLEKEISALKESSQTSVNEVKRLSGTVSSKDVELESLRQELSEVGGQLNNLKDILAKSERESVEKEEVRQRDHSKAVSDLEDKLKKMTTSKEKLEKSKEEAIAALNEKVKTLVTEHDTKLGSIQSELNMKIQEKEQAEKKIKLLEESLAAKSDESSTALTSIHEKLAATEKELASIIADHDQLGDKLSELEKVKQDLEEKVKDFEEIKSAKQMAEHSNNDLKGKLLEVEEKLRNNEEVRHQLERDIESMRNSSLDSSSQAEKLSQELKAKSDEVTNLKEELSKLKVESTQSLSSLESRLKESEDEFKKQVQCHQNAVAKHEASNQALNAELKTTKANLTDVKAQLDRKIKEFKDVSAEDSKKAAEALEEKEQELTKFYTTNKSLETSLFQAEEALRKAKNEKIEIEQEFEEFKRSHDEEMGELVDAVTDLKEKEEQLFVTKDQLAAKLAAFEQLTRKYENLERDKNQQIEKLQEDHQKDVHSLQKSLEEQKSQVTYLKDSMGGSKVEHDLQVEKISKELELERERSAASSDKFETLIKKLKDDLANKDDEIEFIKEELKNKTEELDEIQTDLDIKEASFSNSIKESDESHKEEVEVLVSKVEEAKAEAATLHEKLTRAIADHDAKIDELLASKKVEVNGLQDKVSEKERAIVDLEATKADLMAQIQSLKSHGDDDKKITEAKMNKLSSENEELRSKNRDLESSMKSLQSDFEQINHQKEDLSIKVVEKERQVKEITTQVQTMKVSYEKHQREISEKLERSVEDNQKLSELEAAITEERHRADELQVSLGEAESERDCLLVKVEELKALSKENATLEAERKSLLTNLEDMKTKMEFQQEQFEKERAELNEVVHKSKITLQEKIDDFKNHKRRYDDLASENQQLNSYKRSVMMLEQEKRELESKVVSLTLESRAEAAGAKSANATATNNGDVSDPELRGQVDFLNSVIVDMQRKNDELKMKLDLYESAGIAGDEMEFIFNGVSSRQVAPRLFCDICDKFDVHDTEDCPTQAQSMVEEHSHTKSKAVRGAQRPYCNTCEMFGHDTADCDEAETF